MHRFAAVNDRSDARTPCNLGEHDRLQRFAASRPDVISFAGGLPDPALFPKRELTQAFVSALAAHDAAALQYGWPEGSAGLRHHVSQRLALRGAKVEPERVVITSGAQQAIALALQNCIRRGSVVGVDAETYPGALDVLRRANAVVTALDEVASAYYTMPALSNPRGQIMSSSARNELILRARQHGAWILEDDAYAETTFGEPARPLLADCAERVFHIGTFSKTLCPGLRVGWLVPPKRFLKRCLRGKQASDLQTNSLAQALVERYLDLHSYDAHVAKPKRRYLRRRNRLAGALRQHLPQLRFEQPEGGFSIWLESTLRVDEAQLLDVAIAHGVSFDAGSGFRAQRSRSSGLSLRLSFSCVPEQQIEEGTRRLAGALAAVRSA